MSTPSIQRGERSEKNPFRRSNASDVLRALSRVAALTENESELYLKLTGLEALAEMGRRSIARVQSQAVNIATAVRDSGNAADFSDQPGVDAAHTLLQNIIDAHGVDEVTALLRSVAILSGVPKSHEDLLWIVHGPVVRHAGGGISQEIRAVRPTDPTTRRAQPIRRTGA